MVISAKVVNSILSANVRVHENAQLDSSIIFDGVEIGAGAKLRRCIVDKDVRIPAGMEIGYDHEADSKLFKVTDNGIVVVPKDF